MNVVVCQHYGLLGHVKVAGLSAEDMQVPLAARRIWVRGGREIEKIASLLSHPSMADDIRSLGGPDEAMEVVRRDADAMRTWDEAEALGRDLALSQLESEVEAASGGR